MSKQKASYFIGGVVMGGSGTGNETEDYIRIRHKENSNLEYPYHHRCVVSTNGELDSILAEVRTIAWQHL